jgi:gliding motility-associated-like protein
MLVVNGSSTPGLSVWEQTITVLPNTEYAFSAWAMTVVSSNPAQLSFSINGTQIGNTFNLSSTTCSWQQFSTIWNSGANTSATIAIVNQNTAGGGNDFALDDIEFSSVCEYSDTIQISIPNAPQLTLLSNDTVCKGDSIMLVAQVDIPGSAIDWFHSSETNDTIYVAPTFTTSYSASAISPQNCFSNTASVLITVGDKPELTASADQVMCEGDSIEISFTSVEPLSSFQWLPNDINATQGFVSPTSSTTYIVAGVNEWGCTDSDSVAITVFPIPNVSFEQNEFSICRGDSIIASLSYDSTITTQFNWSFGNHNASSYSYFPDSDDSISIRITQNGCHSKTDTLRVSVTEIPSIDSIENITTCPGEEVTFTTIATPSEATITWAPDGATGEEFVTSTEENLLVSAIAQLNQCRSNRVEAEIIIVDSCLCLWMIPNVFTPNGDDVNDVFGVIDLNESCKFSGFELVIYNRWGEKVWEGINQEKPWDGKSNGNLLPSGTYFWKLNMTDQFNKKVTESGTVTLLE